MIPPTLPPPLPTARPRAPSAFVNVIAWLSLVMAALGVLGGLLQAAILASLDLDGMLAAILSQEGAEMVPPQLQWLFTHYAGINALSTLAAVATLVLSWGLLRRREWARIGFIVLLVLGAVMAVASSVFFAGMFDWIVDSVAQQPGADPALRSMFNSSKLSLYMSSGAIVLLHLGVAWKLQSAEIRAEFPRA